MRTPKTLSTFALLFLTTTSLALAQKAAVGPKQDVPLNQFIDKHFDRWDLNKDGALDLEEVDRKVEDHNVRGREAAVINQIRRQLTAKGKPPRLTHEQLLTLAQDRAFAKSVDATVKRLQTIDRELFLPTDPELTTFNQGRLEDCYLLSTIAAQVHRSPKAIRDMIQPVVTGGFQVVFGDGQKIQVGRLTDAELLLGAKLDDHHGSWLAVLEKAYGIIRKHGRQQQGKYSAANGDSVPTETLGGGNSGTIITLLTGHQAGSLKLGKTAPRDQVHNLLVDMTKKRRLVCAGVSVDKPPPGMGNHHAYAILAYDASAAAIDRIQSLGQQLHPQGPGRSGQRLSNQARSVQRPVGPIPAGLYARGVRDRQAAEEMSGVARSELQAKGVRVQHPRPSLEAQDVPPKAKCACRYCVTRNLARARMSCDDPPTSTSYSPGSTRKACRATS